jgi:hypothetical protein
LRNYLIFCIGDNFKGRVTEFVDKRKVLLATIFFKIPQKIEGKIYELLSREEKNENVNENAIYFIQLCKTKFKKIST